MATLAIHSRLRYLAIAGVILLCAGVWYWLYTTGVVVDYPTIVATEVASTVALLDSHSLAEVENFSAGEATLLRAELISHLAVIVDTVQLAEREHPSPFEGQELLTSLETLQMLLASETAKLEVLDARAGLTLESDSVWQSSTEHLEAAITHLEAHLVSSQ